MKKYKNGWLNSLRDAIKNKAAEGAKARIKWNSLRGDERHAVRHNYVTTTRPEARALLLAYAALRGRTRNTQEAKKTEETTVPYDMAGELRAIGLDLPNSLCIEWMKGDRILVKIDGEWTVEPVKEKETETIAFQEARV